jgi:arylesterase/paraoxonase
VLRRFLIAFAVLVAAVGGWLVWLMNAAGEFRTLTPHFDGTCTAVPVVGAEDLTIDQGTGIAYISSADRWALFAEKPPKGALYAYDLNAPSPQAVNLTPDADPSFSPHGISLYVAADGSRSLFVINHAQHRHTIEVYDVAGSRLTHRTTLADPRLISPNDLVAVSPTQVYVTNDHRYPPGTMRTIEEYLRRPWANVVMWDGHAFREAARGIQLANGINRSADGTTLYVVSTIGRAVRVYDRDAASGTLTFRREIPLASGGDNVEVDADGSLWIGSHPKLLTLVRYMSHGRPYAPSQILHVVAPDTAPEVREVYLDLGEQISGASVGAVRGKRLLIGAIADSKLLDCTMR